MSIDQIVFTVAGAVCVAGAVTAVAHRDARTAGVALAGTLLALAVLYAGLAAPMTQTTPASAKTPCSTLIPEECYSPRAASSGRVGLSTGCGAVW